MTFYFSSKEVVFEKKSPNEYSSRFSKKSNEKMAWLKAHQRNLELCYIDRKIENVIRLFFQFSHHASKFHSLSW